MKLSARIRPAIACLAASFAVIGLSALPGATPATAAPQAGFGTIKGKLVWGGATVPEPKKIDANKDPNVCGKPALVDQGLTIDPKTKGVAFGIAYIATPKGENAAAVKALVAKSPKVVIDQKNCEFTPHSVALNEGQEVEFLSTDPVNHNIHTTAFNNGSFNQMVAPGQKLGKKFAAEKRAISLVCDIHPWMKGNIMVFAHPFFAVTGPDGSFEIAGVPPGTQNLVVWQEKVGYANGPASGKPVVVKAGEATDVGEIKVDPAKVK